MVYDRRELRQVLLDRLESSISYKVTLKFRKMSLSTLQRERSRVLSEFEVHVGRFTRLPGSFLDPMFVLERLCIDFMQTISPATPSQDLELVVKLYADGTLVREKCWIELGLSIVYPLQEHHQSMNHHYLFGLVKCKESLDVMEELYRDIEMNDFVQRANSLSLTRDGVTVNVRIVFVADWMLHVYSNVGMGEPNLNGNQEVLSYCSGLTAELKNRWFLSPASRVLEGPRAIDTNLRALLPSVHLDDRLYDPMHGNARQLTAVMDCSLQVLSDIGFPHTDEVNRLLADCNFSFTSGFNPKFCKVFLSTNLDEMIHILHEIYIDADGSAPIQARVSLIRYPWRCPATRK